MSLLEEFMTPCVLIEKIRQSDGEGGFVTLWREGPGFDAAIVRDQTMQARIAEHDGVKSIFTVTTDKTVKLDYHDVFKRLKDGKIFRVTSDKDDVESPDRATHSMHQVTAEKWELTS